MKRKIQFITMILLVSTAMLYAQTDLPIDPYGMTAISVSRQDVYASKPQILKYNIIYTLKNALWDGSVFTAHRNGLFLVTVSFLKDAYYNNGTEDDVTIEVYKEDTSGTRVYKGRAWCGQGTGKRGTGTYTVVIELQEGEKILTIVKSDSNKPWNVEESNLTIYSLPSYIY